MKTFSPITIDCFKAYDIRGELGVNLDETIAYRIGRAFAQILLSQTSHINPAIVIGCDIRPSSQQLKLSAIDGIIDAGVDVIDLGMTGTEEVYFATSYYDAIGGIEVTASHNPINYNGMKLVRENSKPISADSGLANIQKLAQSGDFTKHQQGKVTVKTDKTAYIDKLMSFINLDNLTPKTLVINSGNGSAGPVVDELQKRFKDANAPIEFINLHHTPDGSFPNGIPNPMIIANQKSTSNAVIKHQADIGIAFDGDFDRCFLFDETGRFIEGSYIVGLLAESFLKKYPNERIVYDPRVIYNTQNIIDKNHGIKQISKSGHSFIKDVMRKTGAIYGGEMSAHHYFRDFFFCDSGMIVWLLVIELLSVTKKTLSELVNDYIKEFPSSGELNFKLAGIQADDIKTALEAHYQNQNFTKDTLDGLSLDFGHWRFNLRSSNTEPLIRLNIETCGDDLLLQDKINEITSFLIRHQAIMA